MYRQRRLQVLAQTPISPLDLGSGLSHSPIPSASGLSVQSLRGALRRVERGIEADLLMMDDGESMERPVLNQPTPVESHEVTTKVRLSDSQQRMALWLNALPITKYVTWYPDVTNSHAVIIVR